MPDRRTHLTSQSSHGELAAALAALRKDPDVPGAFSEAALDEARAAVPEPPTAGLTDLRSVPFVTLDPPGAMDLDQAFHIERDPGDSPEAGAVTGTGTGTGTRTASEPTPGGWLVRYAIADLPGYVAPGGALDEEARLRGQTLYLPDGKIPLHPEELSERRASLLPNEDRRAFVWSVRLDAAGAVLESSVERAVVRSRAQLDYPAAQAEIDAGRAEGPLALLQEFGAARIAQERLRGGASLNMPDEEIVRDESGYRIERRFPLPVEEWNAQLSLLVGIVAGEMMLGAGVGILRTLPLPTEEALAEFRERVAALGRPWPSGESYGEFLRDQDRDDPRTASVLLAAAALFRGADYVAFDGEPPADPNQAAIAAPYAHVTAPLRRLVDRWGLVVCAAISAGEEVPGWARSSLSELPEIMRRTSQRAGQLDSAALARVEAALLRDRVGEVLPATVVEAGADRARIQVSDPAITESVRAQGLAPGDRVDVRVVRADVQSGEIELEVAAAAQGSVESTAAPRGPDQEAS